MQAPSTERVTEQHLRAIWQDIECALAQAMATGAHPDTIDRLNRAADACMLRYAALRCTERVG